MGPVASALIGIVVVAWVIWNQLRPRTVDARRLRIAVALGIVGAVQVASTMSDHPASAVALGLLVVGLVIGAGLGVWRARSAQVWTAPDGRVMTQGSRFTAGLWIVGIGAHVGLDLLARAVDPASAPVDGASILLFVAVSIGVQALVTLNRGHALAPAGA